MLLCADGLLAPMGTAGALGLLGFETPAAAAGFPGPAGWLLRGMPRVVSGGVHFTRLESAILAGQGGVINGVSAGLALETGIAIGAAFNAAAMPCSETHLVGF